MLLGKAPVFVTGFKADCNSGSLLLCIGIKGPSPPATRAALPEISEKNACKINYHYRMLLLNIIISYRYCLYFYSTHFM